MTKLKQWLGALEKSFISPREAILAAPVRELWIYGQEEPRNPVITRVLKSNKVIFDQKVAYLE